MHREHQLQISLKESFGSHHVMLQVVKIPGNVGGVRGTRHHCLCLIYLFHVTYLF